MANIETKPALKSIENFCNLSVEVFLINKDIEALEFSLIRQKLALTRARQGVVKGWISSKKYNLERRIRPLTKEPLTDLEVEKARKDLADCEDFYAGLVLEASSLANQIQFRQNKTRRGHERGSGAKP